MEFLDELARIAAPESRVITCGFVGDPNVIGKEAWRPRSWAPGMVMPYKSNYNAYVTIASFYRAEDSTWRRRKESFACGLALMVDDVGTKVDKAKVKRMKPSAIIETSPGNYQYWYFFKEALADSHKFNALIKAFIDQALAGNDPGMAGVTRVGRIPGYVNGKAKYDGWRVELRELSAKRYEPGELIEGFDLKTVVEHSRPPRPPPSRPLIQARIAEFQIVANWLTDMKLMKSDWDRSGWAEVACPWKDSHTAAADNGAAIALPSPDNGFFGGFRCHHGHCQDKGWRELTEWINEESVDFLESINNER